MTSQSAQVSGKMSEIEGQTYYVIRIAMKPEEVAKVGNVTFVPGMPVEAFVQTGDRTMFSYFMKPFHDQLMRVFRER